MTDGAKKQSEFSGFDRFEEKEVDLATLVNLVKQNYKLVLIITTAFLILGIGYIKMSHPVYQSTALVQVADTDTSSMVTDGRTMLGGRSMAGSQAKIETTLLKSPYILADVVKKIGAEISVSPHYSGFFAKKLAQIRGERITAKVSALTLPNLLLGKLLTLIVEKNNTVTLETSDGKKILSGRIGSMISHHYAGFPISIKVESVNAPVGSKFTVMKYPLSIASDNLSGGLSIKEQGESTGLLKVGYTSPSPAGSQNILKKILASAIEKDGKKKLEKATKSIHFILSQLPHVKHDLERSQNKLIQFSISSGVYNGKIQVKSLMAAIAHLRQMLEVLSLEKTALLNRFTKIHPLVIAETEKEKRLQKKLLQLKKQLKSLPSSIQRELNLERDIKIQGEMYGSIFSNLEELDINRAGMVSGVSLLSGPSYPAFPMPNKNRTILLGSLFFGFIVSLGVIFIRFVLSPVVEDPDIVERKLGLPVIGILPFSDKQKAHNKAVARNKMLTSAFLLANKHPKDICIEALRGLRTAVQVSLLTAKDNVLAITGCAPSIGKSFITSNLSFLISDLSKRVLVIDSDMRLGKMHDVFGKQKNIGLSTYLSGEAEIKDIIQPVLPDKLDFISVGIYPENPSELLSNEAFSKLINHVKGQYDVVVIDTPPILAVTDPSLILHHSSINLMVVGVGKNHIKEVGHAKNVLEKSGVMLTGLIFNNLKTQKAGYGYGCYGNYGHHYGYDKQN